MVCAFFCKVSSMTATRRGHIGLSQAYNIESKAHHGTHSPKCDTTICQSPRVHVREKLERHIRQARSNTYETGDVRTGNRREYRETKKVGKVEGNRMTAIYRPAVPRRPASLVELLILLLYPSFSLRFVHIIYTASPPLPPDIYGTLPAEGVDSAKHPDVPQEISIPKLHMQ